MRDRPRTAAALFAMEYLGPVPGGLNARCNPILTNAVTFRPQLLRDPRTAVAASRAPMRLANPIEQLAIGLRPSALWPTYQA